MKYLQSKAKESKTPASFSFFCNHIHPHLFLMLLMHSGIITWAIEDISASIKPSQFSIIFNTGMWFCSTFPERASYRVVYVTFTQEQPLPIPLRSVRSFLDFLSCVICWPRLVETLNAWKHSENGLQETPTKKIKQLLPSSFFAITFILPSSSFCSFIVTCSVELLKLAASGFRHLSSLSSSIQVCDFARLFLNALHIELHLLLSQKNNHFFYQCVVCGVSSISFTECCAREFLMWCSVLANSDIAPPIIRSYANEFKLPVDDYM